LQFTAPAAAAAKPTDKMHLQLNLNVILFKLRSARGSMLLGCCCCCCGAAAAVLLLLLGTAATIGLVAGNRHYLALSTWPTVA